MYFLEVETLLSVCSENEVFISKITEVANFSMDI
jgi:hypothetical protein